LFARAKHARGFNEGADCLVRIPRGIHVKVRELSEGGLRSRCRQVPLAEVTAGILSRSIGKCLTEINPEHQMLHAFSVSMRLRIRVFSNC
jgi:hypothetical protein